MNQPTIVPKLAPIGDKVLVQMMEDQSSGIHSDYIAIPDMAKGPSRLAVVLRLGTEREDDKPFPVREGEQVLLASYCGVDIKVGGQDCKIILTSDIQGVYR